MGRLWVLDCVCWRMLLPLLREALLFLLMLHSALLAPGCHQPCQHPAGQGSSLTDACMHARPVPCTTSLPALPTAPQASATPSGWRWAPRQSWSW